MSDFFVKCAEIFVCRREILRLLLTISGGWYNEVKGKTQHTYESTLSYDNDHHWYEATCCDGVIKDKTGRGNDATVTGDVSIADGAVVFDKDGEYLTPKKVFAVSIAPKLLFDLSFAYYQYYYGVDISKANH